jgi:hypothetical protein
LIVGANWSASRLAGRGLEMMWSANPPLNAI